ncbi:SusC/RagA family TonB-linked outer membrane protein [Carboxylicivirga linearis]|uniref:SusC/RagA family TonB-linked outer membrane protein n=1 Tax=Carboxylicivirga linearis TaxID=1628157 RepID=A0ABS5JXJ0_9BACT|nr:SusC/RagA family TonB-linked outer membrane protein [Carboxylicivirga linearis]MBS2099627.1 SusC/RagA family TonB-linked outer membrane protein [Carboxylicivirga linearis]
MKQIISLKTVLYKALAVSAMAVICTLFVGSPVYAQDDLSEMLAEIDEVRFLTGVVRDAQTKEPIVAAQLSTLNYESAATTDAEGKFSIGITEDTEVILVKAFNYNAREVAVRGNNDLVIELYSDKFNELYFEKENLTKKERTSKVTNSVSTMDVFTPPSFASVDELLQSNLGGEMRSIGRSGLTGIGNAMFIRGLNSVNANAQPLFIVDGVIWNSQYDVESLHAGYFGNTLMNIDVSDIESVSVVKDGTSIYGSKGSNGVVIIKTKRGESMATKIEVNSMYGYIDRPNTLPVMNVNQSRNYASDLVSSMTETEMRSRFGLKPTEGANDLPFLDINPNTSTYADYNNNTNWEDQVYQEGMYHSNKISVNGGDDKALYNFSVGYTGSNGVVKTTDMDRLHSRFNADISILNDVDLGLNVGFTNTNRTLLDDGAVFHTSPTYASLIKSPYLSPFLYTNSGTLTTDPADSDIFGVTNPTALIENALNTNKQYRFNMAIKPTWRINDKLTASSIFDYSYEKASETFYRPINGVADIYLDNVGWSQNMFQGQQLRNISMYSDTRLDHRYKKGLHRVNSLLGFRYLSTDYESTFGEGHNTGTDQRRDLLPDMIDKNTVGIHDQINYLSTYAKVDYSFDNRYFVGASVAVDGSSVFGAETQEGFQLGDHSFGVFPSAEAAWLISSEEFMSSASFVDQLKLRASYGLTGNDDIDAYAGRTYFSSIRYYERMNGLVFGNIGNKELQWETTSRVSAGLETILFNDRWALNADFYRGYTSNLLMLKDLPEVAGNGMYWSNEGEMSNMGVEVSTNIKVLNLSSFKWEAGGSIGHYQNKIEALPGGDMITSIYGADVLTSVGSAAGVFYGYKTNGVFATEADATAANLKMVDKSGTEHYFGAGDMHFVDNGDGIIDENDKQIIGDPNPDFYGSFFTNFTVKNFSINALFTFSYGNDIYNYQRAMLESGSDFINQSTAMTNRWFYEGQQTEMPKATYGDPMGNARFSDRWIEDGSYLRFKTLSLNYKVPIKSSVVSGLNFWVSANNLFTWTNYLGADPEFSSSNSVLYQGIDTGLLPYSRSYYVGVKINL